MNLLNVHVINHTHWDREWFLTSVYTSRWISGLIDKLEHLTAENPDFRYFLDGQTLVIEDLLVVAPEYEQRVSRLIRAGRLQIGPYYCQPDWQMTNGELLVRNLQFGRQDSRRFGITNEVGWLVDTFGHISQAPQIHRLFGIEAVYVWRGVPHLTPYFSWPAPDSSSVLGVNLFGGYRNLYGVTHAPEVAVRRLEKEVQRLSPFYPSADIPLFDGYDLEDNPEDPLRFYAGQEEIGAHLHLQESTPGDFTRRIAEKTLNLPVIQGELNSGKYGATFPGTFSARTYLKVMAYDCEQLLFQSCEPLAVMATLVGRPYPAHRFEQWSRLLLQNAVHDCLCGVSIDQVHEKMEYSYRQMFAEMNAEMQSSLESIMAQFPAGEYAVSTTPFLVDQWQTAGKEIVHVQTWGVGVWPIRERLPVEGVNRPVKTFTWENDYYRATIGEDGMVRVGNAALGKFQVWAEKGDTYTAEAGDLLGAISPTSPLAIVARSAKHAEVGFSGVWRQETIEIQINVRLLFDQSPLVKWHIELDSRGVDICVEMVFETARPGRVMAGMPFDVVDRPVVDNDLLPRELPDDLAPILLGQREVGQTTCFPFQEFVLIDNQSACIAVLAKGLKAYQAGPEGTIHLPLRRAVEWLTKAGLESRVGDAGPFFYVPDARCERAVQHEIGVMFGDFPAGSIQLQQQVSAWQNPPLLVRSQGNGRREDWVVFQENLPISSLTFSAGKPVARIFNPTTHPQPLSRPYHEQTVMGAPLAIIRSVPPKKIVDLRLTNKPNNPPSPPAGCEIISRPVWRVGRNQGLPDPAILTGLENQISNLEAELFVVEEQVKAAQGAEKLRRRHRWYVLSREKLEYQLSLLLNRRKLAQGNGLIEDYLFTFDPEIAELGWQLNQMRIKRRIFDYVVQAL